MIGTIVGDVLGSIHESKKSGVEDKTFEIFDEASRFTDDTVMTVATMEAILTNTSYHSQYKKWARKYPNAGFGGMFIKWFESEEFYTNDSYGNGAAMRVSPIPYAFKSETDIIRETTLSTLYTHDCEESLNGALAIALSIYWAKIGKSKKEIYAELLSKFKQYDLTQTLDECRNKDFSCRCNITVPHALIAFLKSKDYEDCIRNSIFIGGDADTVAAMSGGIAHAYYKSIPFDFIEFTYSKLTPEMRSVIIEFNKKYKNVPQCISRQKERIDNSLG